MAKIKYSYHYMDSQASLIFRYDNAYHHSQLNTYPHHKHLEETVVESMEPNLYDVLIEVQSVINTKT